MDIEYTNLFHSQPSKIYPNWSFWFENIPPGNPAFRQGDQIGRIFAQWMIFAIGSYIKISEAAHFFGYFIQQLSLCFNLNKNGLGYILVEFFINSSGNPASRRHQLEGPLLAEPSEVSSSPPARLRLRKVAHGKHLPRGGGKAVRHLGQEGGPGHQLAGQRRKSSAIFLKFAEFSIVRCRVARW
jgi:hypothetical protein